MKVVLDTNVLLSAFLIDGICARILRRARNKELTFIFCASVLKETQRLMKDTFTFTHREIAFFFLFYQKPQMMCIKPRVPFQVSVGIQMMIPFFFVP